MPALPWKHTADVDPGADHVVFGTCLPLVGHRHIPRFLLQTLAIRRQLAHTPGLVGYGLDADLVHATFWTVSAWRSDADLRAFAAADPHRSSSHSHPTRMGHSRFARWTALGRDLPPTWDGVRQHLT